MTKIKNIAASDLKGASKAAVWSPWVLADTFDDMVCIF